MEIIAYFLTYILNKKRQYTERYRSTDKRKAIKNTHSNYVIFHELNLKRCDDKRFSKTFPIKIIMINTEFLNLFIQKGYLLLQAKKEEGDGQYSNMNILDEAKYENTAEVWDSP